jgi:hypothetical protein
MTPAVWVRIAVTFLVCLGGGGASALWVRAWLGAPATFALYAALTVLGTILYVLYRGGKHEPFA